MEKGGYIIFSRSGIYNTAQAVYHVSPEIYYNLLAGKSCSLPNAGTHLSIQPLWNFPFLKGSIPVCSVYKKPESISLRNVSVKKAFIIISFDLIIFILPVAFPCKNGSAPPVHLPRFGLSYSYEYIYGCTRCNCCRQTNPKQLVA